MSRNPAPAPAAHDVGGVSSFRRGNIAHLILGREHALNAWTSTMVERLHSALSRCATTQRSTCCCCRDRAELSAPGQM
jgi:hypothetical protein